MHASEWLRERAKLTTCLDWRSGRSRLYSPSVLVEAVHLRRAASQRLGNEPSRVLASSWDYPLQLQCARRRRGEIAPHKQGGTRGRGRVSRYTAKMAPDCVRRLRVPDRPPSDWTIRGRPAPSWPQSSIISTALPSSHHNTSTDRNEALQLYDQSDTAAPRAAGAGRACSSPLPERVQPCPA